MKITKESLINERKECGLPEVFAPLVDQSEPPRNLRQIEFTNQKWPLGKQIKECIEYRRFFLRFLKTVLFLRFARSILGGVWLILSPLMPALVMVIVLSGLKLDSGSAVPLPLFALTNLVYWRMFATLFGFQTTMFRKTEDFMSKQYYPSLFQPLSSVTEPLLHVLVGGSVVFLFTVYLYFKTGVFYIQLDLPLLLFPVLMILMVAVALGAGIYAGIVNSITQDVQFGLPLVNQAGMFVCPIIYSISVIPEQYQPAYRIFNPLANLFEALSWSIYGAGEPHWGYFAYSVIFIILLLWTAFRFMAKVDPLLGGG